MKEEKKVVIAHDLQPSHSMVSITLKYKEKLREAVKGLASLKFKMITNQRQWPIYEMEKLLMQEKNIQHLRKCQMLKFPALIFRLKGVIFLNILMSFTNKTVHVYEIRECIKKCK